MTIEEDFMSRPCANEPRVTFFRPTRKIEDDQWRIADIVFQHPDHTFAIPGRGIRAIFIDHRNQPRIILAANNTKPLFTAHPLCERNRLVFNFRETNTSLMNKVALTLQDI